MTNLLWVFSPATPAGAFNSDAETMKPLSDQHVFDYRPRFSEADHQLIQAVARKLDIPPAVLIRRLVQQQLAGLITEDAANKVFQ